MAKVLVRLKSGQGFFEDVTQPNGKAGTGKWRKHHVCRNLSQKVV